MNKTYSYPTTKYDSILVQMKIFLVLILQCLLLTLKKRLSKIEENKYQIYVHLDENAFIHCCHVTVVHVYVNVFSKIHPACYSDGSGINQGSNPK